MKNLDNSRKTNLVWKDYLEGLVRRAPVYPVKTVAKNPDLVREVVIIGAGASEPYGTPPFGAFCSAAKQIFQQEEIPFGITIIWERLYPNLTLEEFYTMLSFLVDIDVQLDLDYRDEFTPEQVKALQATPYVAGNKLDLKAILTDLYKLIPIVIFASTNPVKSKVYDNLARYGKRVQETTPGGGKAKYRAFEIISFNWDTLAELAIRAQGLHPHYFPREDAGRLLQMSVLKPHGSLEAAVCRNDCAYEYPLRMPRAKEYGNRAWTPDVCPSCGKPLELVLLPPHFVKAAQPQAKRWTKEVFKQIYSSIKFATKLTLVGYSLPATDYTFRLMFRMALAVRQNLKEVTVVSRAKSPLARAEFESNYKALFRSAGFNPDSIVFDYSGVEAWSATLVQGG